MSSMLGLLALLRSQHAGGYRVNGVNVGNVPHLAADQGGAGGWPITMGCPQCSGATQARVLSANA
eukprot:1886519-Amphidinium_carterae.1